MYAHQRFPRLLAGKSLKGKTCLRTALYVSRTPWHERLTWVKQELGMSAEVKTVRE